MIRQRVDRHGNIYPLEPASSLVACNIPPTEIGVIKPGPVRKWLAAKGEWDTKFASQKRKVQRRRAKEFAEGYEQFGNGEVPPPSALAGRRLKGSEMRAAKNKKSMGMSLWSVWGSKHDEKTKVLEDKLDKVPETSVATATDGKGARPVSDNRTVPGTEKNLKLPQEDNKSRSRSRRRTVVDRGQTGSKIFLPSHESNEDTPAAVLLKSQYGESAIQKDDPLLPAFVKDSDKASEIPGIKVHEEYDLKRPKADGIAFPFTVKGHQATASMTTLTSDIGVPPAKDVVLDGALESGISPPPTQDSAVAVSSKQKAEVAAGTHNQRVEEDDDKTPVPSPGIDEKVIVGGAVFKEGQRPPMETFVTAQSHLTTLKDVRQ